MSSVKSKPKLKKYYIKKSINRKLCLEANLKGFLCSCNNREKDCIRESYNLLNQYADKLYPSSSTQDYQTEDVDDLLNKEISELKEESKTNRRFQVIESGAKNFLFIRTTLDNPVELAETIVKDIHQTGNQKTRFLLRLIPVEITCKAYITDITKAFEQIVDMHFKEKAQTFSVMFNHRNNDTLSRDEIIKLMAEKVFKTRTDHKVDLKTADVSIIVEIIRGYAFLSVVPNYLRYKKYNLLSICDNEQTKDEALQTDYT
ncbi:THUMP domain containing protein [Asbolus verrucosus]|uniref:THUMP domain containing protein n=1 Tax=Asbolus verrucosus TaxID=1661398 RepID=A0A482W1G4_ASBVE|nr:THUMP domain containing protein [Asbolus verrucosus]